MKKPPCPHASIGEICYSYSEKKQGGSTIALEHAVRAMQKVSDPDERIQLLMDIEQWKPAVEEIFATKRQDTEVL